MARLHEPNQVQPPESSESSRDLMAPVDFVKELDKIFTADETRSVPMASPLLRLKNYFATKYADFRISNTFSSAVEFLEAVYKEWKNIFDSPETETFYRYRFGAVGRVVAIDAQKAKDREKAERIFNKVAQLLHCEHTIHAVLSSDGTGSRSVRKTDMGGFLAPPSDTKPISIPASARVPDFADRADGVGEAQNSTNNFDPGLLARSQPTQDDTAAGDIIEEAPDTDPSPQLPGVDPHAVHINATLPPSRQRPRTVPPEKVIVSGPQDAATPPEQPPVTENPGDRVTNPEGFRQITANGSVSAASVNTPLTAALRDIATNTGQGTQSQSTRETKPPSTVPNTVAAMKKRVNQLKPIVAPQPEQTALTRRRAWFRRSAAVVVAAAVGLTANWGYRTWEEVETADEQSAGVADNNNQKPLPQGKPTEKATEPGSAGTADEAPANDRPKGAPPEDSTSVAKSPARLAELPNHPQFINALAKALVLERNGKGLLEQLLGKLGSLTAEQKKALRVLNEKVNRGAYARAMKDFGHLMPAELQRILNDPTHKDRSRLRSFMAAHPDSQKWSRKVRGSDGKYALYHRVFSQEMKYYDKLVASFNRLNGRDAGANIAMLTDPAFYEKGKGVKLDMTVNYVYDLVALLQEVETAADSGRTGAFQRRAPEWKHAAGGVDVCEQGSTVTADVWTSRGGSSKKVDTGRLLQRAAWLSDVRNAELIPDDCVHDAAEPGSADNVDMSYIRKVNDGRGERVREIQDLLRLPSSIVLRNGKTFWQHMKWHLDLLPPAKAAAKKAALAVLEQWKAKSQSFGNMPFAVAGYVDNGVRVEFRESFQQEMVEAAMAAMGMNYNYDGTKFDTLDDTDIEEVNGVPLVLKIPNNKHPFEALEDLLVGGLKRYKRDLAENPFNISKIAEVDERIEDVEDILAEMRRQGLAKCQDGFLSPQDRTLRLKRKWVDMLAEAVGPDALAKPEEISDEDLEYLDEEDGPDEEIVELSDDDFEEIVEDEIGEKPAPPVPPSSRGTLARKAPPKPSRKAYAPGALIRKAPPKPSGRLAKQRPLKIASTTSAWLQNDALRELEKTVDLGWEAVDEKKTIKQITTDGKLTMEEVDAGWDLAA